jgi:hypothetical protein
MDGGKFMEFDIWVCDICFVVEGWVNDLEFGDIFIPVIVSEWFRYIDDNPV